MDINPQQILDQRQRPVWAHALGYGRLRRGRGQSQRAHAELAVGPGPGPSMPTWKAWSHGNSQGSAVALVAGPP